MVGQCAAMVRQIIAGKLQNSRNSLLRAARETDTAAERDQLTTATDALARQIQDLGRWTPDELGQPGAMERLRGAEGMGAVTCFVSGQELSRIGSWEGNRFGCC